MQPHTEDPKKRVEDPHSAVVYFHPKEDDAPEILLFEEDAVRTRKWRRVASDKGRQFWARMRERMEHMMSDVFAPDRFVSRLKGFRKMTVLLNKPIDPAVVRERLRTIFRDRSYHHLRWLIVDVLLLPTSLLLVPLPGPNVIGYYLLYRVYSHYRSFRSASRAQIEEIDVQVSHDAHEVNTLLRRNKDVRSALHELRKLHGLRALQEHEFIPHSFKLKEAWSRMKKSFSRQEPKD